MSIRILLVEDDYPVGEIMQRSLEHQGYEVCHCADGSIAWRTFKKKKFDICLLDVVMPKLNGFELGKKIRAVDKFVPIIYISGKVMDADKIMGLSIGADDYVPKPFTMAELILRIQVFLKHVGRAASKAVYPLGGYILDMERLVMTKNGINAGLTMQEVKILFVLRKNIKNTISRENLINEIWGRENPFTSRSLHVLICRIRKRLENDRHIEIETIRNVGYRLQVYDGID